MVGIFGALSKGSSRLQRAQEQGFDVDNSVYHGTHADNIAAFDDSKIGNRDEGFFGRGHYFADGSGEARYYGPNVNEYVVRGKMLNLDTPSSMSAASVDYERKKFKYQMGKLSEIDALDEPQTRGLQAVKDLENYVDENVIVGRGRNDDGSEGFHVRVPKPFLTKYADGSTDQQYKSGSPGGRGIHFNLDRKEAIENLKNDILYDILYNRSDNTFSNKFKDVNLAMLGLSDYVRNGGVGSEKLTEKAKQAGYDGIKVADETVVFDAKNIRHVDAQFDPAKTDSSNVLASGAPVATGLLGATALIPEEAAAAPTLADQGAGIMDFLANAAQGAIAPISNAPNTIIQALTSDRSNEQLKADRDQRLAQNDYQLRTDLGQQYTQNAQQTIGGLLQALASQPEIRNIIEALGVGGGILQTTPEAYNQIPERGRIVTESLLDAVL